MGVIAGILILGLAAGCSRKADDSGTKTAADAELGNEQLDSQPQDGDAKINVSDSMVNSAIHDIDDPEHRPAPIYGVFPANADLIPLEERDKPSLNTETKDDCSDGDACDIRDYREIKPENGLVTKYGVRPLYGVQPVREGK